MSSRQSSDPHRRDLAQATLNSSNTSLQTERELKLIIGDLLDADLDNKDPDPGGKNRQ